MTKSDTLLLIHGAWQDSSCFKKTHQQLAALGYRVLSPDLPGHGLLIRPPASVLFADYVEAVINVIKKQPEPVILVGHSMAGLIISQVASIIPEHIKELIYLAAFIPTHHQSLFSLADTLESNNMPPYLQISQEKKEIRLKISTELGAILFNRCSQSVARAALKKLQPQPLQPFTAKVNLNQHFQHIPKRSIVCRDDRALLLSDQIKMSKQVTDRIIAIDADHSPFYSAEDALMAALTNP